MVVICQIHLKRPPNSVYFPGSTVEGIVKYQIDKDTMFKSINVNFKGLGKCEWSNGITARNKHIGTELIFKQVKQVLENQDSDKVLVSAGTYCFPFKFVIPNNIPPTYYDDICFIHYYISFKLTQSGKYNATKKFSTKIPICSTVKAQNEGNIIYGVRKELTELFSTSKGVINVRAILFKSLLKPEENIEVIYDINNESNVNIPEITCNLVEFITYTDNYGNKATRIKKIKQCKTAIKNVDPRSSKSCRVNIATIADIVSIHHSEVLNRDYKLVVNIKLPMPHLNAQLEIPLNIGYTSYEDTPAQETCEVMQLADQPPSYWEAMEEETF